VVAQEQGITIEAIVDDHLLSADLPGVLLRSAADAGAETNPTGIASCAHERGVYWVIAHRDSVGELNFDEACLKQVSKLSMGDALLSTGVEITTKRRLTEVMADGSWDFPHILKPNFGFASTLVKRVRSLADVDDYLRSYDAIRSESPLAEYEAFARAHVPDALEVVVEPDHSQSSRFVTAPVRVCEGTLVGVYPIFGAAAVSGTTTDFHWSGFETAEPDVGLVAALRRDLARLIDIFGLTGGVYEIEVLYDELSGNVRFLEFSPRVTGGLLPDLIQQATGVDLHRLGLLYFLGLSADLPVEHPMRALTLTREVIPGADEAAASPDALVFWTRSVGDVRYLEQVRPAGLD
jgi:hypothetical protein